MSAYTVHLVPKEHTDAATWASIIAKQKALRLRSLQIAPEAFSSTYEREIAFTDEEWEKRMQHSSAHTFAAVKTLDHGAGANEVKEEESEDQKLVEGDWVGMDVLFGPLDQSNDELEDGAKKAIHFEIFGLFVLPSARGLGVGKKLVDIAVAHGKMLGMKQGLGEVVIKVRAVPTNKSVVSMYDTLGFKTIEGASHEAGSDSTVSMALRLDV